MTAGELDGYRAVYEEEVAQISVLTLMVQEAASPESVRGCLVALAQAVRRAQAYNDILQGSER